jgi:hypothetical protein
MAERKVLVAALQSANIVVSFTEGTMSQKRVKVRRFTPHRCGQCDGCMAHYQKIVDRDRPGHVWTVIDGKIVYMEDAIMEGVLGRKLKYEEQVIHKNGDLFDNRRDNLEIVTVARLEP